ncbi:site-specific integrase [Cupriavidus sp. PET2-C1]
MPIHPELVRLGFLEYVQAMREARHTHLFPALNNTSKGSAAVFGEWFRIRLDEIGITDELETFHAFRHTVRSELASLHIGQETTDAILGHVPTGSTGATTYTHIRLKGMADALAQVRYPVELKRVYPRR